MGADREGTEEKTTDANVKYSRAAATLKSLSEILQGVAAPAGCSADGGAISAQNIRS